MKAINNNKRNINLKKRKKFIWFTFCNKSIDVSINVLPPVCDWSPANTTLSNLFCLSGQWSAICASTMPEHHDTTTSLLKYPFNNKQPNGPNVYWLEAKWNLKKLVFFFFFKEKTN